MEITLARRIADHGDDAYRYSRGARRQGRRLDGARRRRPVPEVIAGAERRQRWSPAPAALDHRLAATDRLIDRIVYVLYGLSDDEIAIVEGKGGVDASASV